jgi:hypothetical protein
MFDVHLNSRNQIFKYKDIFNFAYVFYNEVNESNIIKEFKNLLKFTTLDDEFTFLFMNKTWKLDDLPPNRTLVNYKWVL